MLHKKIKNYVASLKPSVILCILIRLIEDPKSFTGRGEFWNWKTQDLDDLERSNYLPPEVLGQKKSGSETDIW